GPPVGEGGGGRVVIGLRGPRLEIPRAFERLSQQLGADDLAVLRDLRAVCLVREGDLRDTGHRQRIDEPEQDREDDDGQRTGDEVLAHQKRWLVRPSTTGPRSRAGKNVRAPTITTTPTSSTTKVGVSVRIVP